ncbi:MAG TPA: hypothetical protein VF407_22950 [Polyangiaceae bacterium]
MSAEEILEEFTQVLALEREAIRKTDAKGVLEAAMRKEKLAADLVESGAWTRADMVPSLKKLVEELRNNGVLLAHARDCLRDAIAALQGSPSAQSIRRIAVRLSVTG